MSTEANLVQLIRDTAARYPLKKALGFKESGQYRFLTWSEVEKKVNLLASFFLEKGIVEADRIGILSENRPEWLIADFSILLSGASTVPIYPTLTPAETEYLLRDSGCRFLLVSGREAFQKVVSIYRQLPRLEGVIFFDNQVSVDVPSLTIPAFHLKKIWEIQPHPELDRAVARIQPTSIASIIYTSGTTGVPKGVMLTHQNFVSNIELCKETLKMGPTDKHLSFLPLCHVFERTAGHFLMVLIGATICYAENLDKVPGNIIETKPTFLLGVPRFFEKIQTKVMDTVSKASPLRRKLFWWAKFLGQRKRLSKTRMIERLLEPFADLLVYKKFKKRLGGNLRFCVSGGASLPKDIGEFFCDLGIMIYEGYGLTETSPVISVNRENKWRFGSVGVPLRTVDVKFTSEGELITKSSCVMKGYFNKPEETHEVLKDGWFYTGDLAKMDPDGFLVITGRKKELIATSGGKKISPRPIEELLEKDEYILRCVLFGEGRKFITAIIIPRQNELLSFARQNKLNFSSYTELLKNKVVIDMLDDRIRKIMENFASYEKIKYFALLENDFTQDSGELTPTLKVRRDVVCQRYKGLLEPFYDIER